jgi:hypothetical protein
MRPARPKGWIPVRPSWYALLYAQILRHHYGVSDTDEIARSVMRRYSESDVRIQLLEYLEDQQ